MKTRLRRIVSVAMVGALMIAHAQAKAAEPLPSWNEGKTKQAIVDFVARVTTQGSPQREWACDRQSSIGRLDKGLDEANAKGWTVVDMAKDWKLIYAFEKR